MEWLFMGFGVFAIAGAIFDWEWFMTHRKARFFMAVLGRTGTRIFYALLGLLLVGLGVALLLGFIEKSKRG